MSVNGNATRQAVFVTLVETDEPMTPTEIGDAIDETRQAVKYHLDELGKMGLVVPDDGAYRVQPVFTDDDFEARFIELLSDLIPEVEERLVVDPDVGAEERTAIVFNCLRLFVAQELLDPVPEND